MDITTSTEETEGSEMLTSVKPFSSPLYEDAALKNATSFAFCKISTTLLQNLSCSAFRLCTEGGVEVDAYSEAVWIA